MAKEPVLSPRQVEEQRTRVIDALTEHFAQDNLTMEQLEERLDQVYAASTSTALAAIVADLPPLAGPGSAIGLSGAATAPPVHAEEGYQSRTLIALMSGVMRRGQWTAPRQLNTIAFMGGVELDFRWARFTSHVTEIYILAVMGGVVVTVPPGVRVESDGFAIMGGFEDGHTTLSSADPAAPVIRLKGLAIMGGVEVRVKAITVEAH